jgi:hypothetical protein
LLSTLFEFAISSRVLFFCIPMDSRIYSSACTF